MKSSNFRSVKLFERLLSPFGISPRNDTLGQRLLNIPKKNELRVGVSVFFFCMGLCFASWASRIPDIKSALNLSDASFGTILLALPAGQLIAMPFSGRLVTNFGSKRILRVSIVLYAFCLLGIAMGTQTWQLVISLMGFGVLGNLCNIAVNTQAIETEKLYGRSIMTSFHGVWSSAGFVGAAIGMLMMTLGLTPYIHFLFVAALVVITTALTQKKLFPGVSGTSETKSFLPKPDGLLIQLGVIGFFSMASEGAMFDWSGIYFKDVVGAPASLIAIGYLSFMITMATGRFIGDRMISKYGRKIVLRVSGLLISAGLFAAVIIPTLLTATIGFLVVGLGVSSIVPMVFSAAGKHPKISPGMALAAVSSISFLGFLIGPPLIGYIAEGFGLRYSFAVIGCLGVSISLLVSKIKALN